MLRKIQVLGKTVILLPNCGLENRNSPKLRTKLDEPQPLTEKIPGGIWAS